MQAIKLAAIALVLGASSMSAQVQQGKADSGKKTAVHAKMAKPDAKAGKTETPAAPKAVTAMAGGDMKDTKSLAKGGKKGGKAKAAKADMSGSAAAKTEMKAAAAAPKTDMKEAKAAAAKAAVGKAPKKP